MSGGLFGRVGAPAPLNTAAANSLAPASGTQQTASLFGGPASAAASSTGGLFGNTTTTSAPAATSLFGAPASATSAPASTGLFGAAPAAGGGLFGNTQTTAPASAGLFGGTQATQPASGGLFGQTAQPAQIGGLGQTGGMFGQPAAQQQQQQQTGGLFGNGTAQQPTGGFFGNNNPQQQQPQQSGGLFSGTQQSAGGLFNGNQQQQGASIYGNPQQQQQQQPQQQQAVQMNMSNLRSTTRYEELHPEIQALATNLDNMIHAQTLLSRELSALSIPHTELMSAIETDVALITRKVSSTKSTLLNDGTSVGHLHEMTSSLINTASLGTRTIDILRLPVGQRSVFMSQQHTTDADYSLIPYFDTAARDMERKTGQYISALGEVEKTLEGMEREVGAVGGGGGGGTEGRAREVVRAERMVFAGMVAVAGRVAGLNEELKEVTGDRMR